MFVIILFFAVNYLPNDGPNCTFSLELKWLLFLPSVPVLLMLAGNDEIEALVEGIPKFITSGNTRSAFASFNELMYSR